MTIKRTIILSFLTGLLAAAQSANAQSFVDPGKGQILEDLTTLRAVVPGHDLGWYAVGELKDPDEMGLETVVVKIDSSGKYKTLGVVCPPHLDDEDGENEHETEDKPSTHPSCEETDAVKTIAHGLVHLKSGELLVAGTARFPSNDDPEAAGSDIEAAWVALVDSDGRTVWSRAQREENKQAILRFAHISAPRKESRTSERVLVGGILQDGGECEDRASGVLYEVNLNDGTLWQQFTNGGDDESPRVAFLSGTNRADGKLVLSGFQTVSDGDHCHYDAIIVGVNDKDNILEGEAFGSSEGSDVAYSITPVGSLIAAGGIKSASDGKTSFGMLRLFQSDWEIVARRDFELGASGNDTIRFVKPFMGNQLMIGGRASKTAAAPNKAWMYLLDQKAEIQRSFLVDGYYATVALAGAASEDQRFVVVGRALDKGNENRRGAWFLTFDPLGVAEPKTVRPNRRFSDLNKDRGTYVLGKLKTTARVANGTAAADQPTRISFNLERQRNVRISVLPKVGDPDIILRSSSGNLVSFSSYSKLAVDLIESDLAQGTYILEIVTADDKTEFDLQLEFVENTARDRTQVVRGVRTGVSRRLSRLGYFSGGKPSIGFGSEAKRAQSAFQISIGHKATGNLTDQQRGLLYKIDALQE